MKKTLLTISTIALFAITGCAVGPNFTKPTVEVMDGYRTDYAPVDSLINLEWWTLFRDADLDTLVRTALKENKNLLIAASRIEEARAALGFTRADLYPKLDIQGSAARGDLANGFKLNAVENNFFIAPVVGWEIDFWGKYRRAAEAARAEMLATRYGFQSVQLSLISEVVGAYFQLIDYKQRLDAAIHTLELREESLDIIQKRFNEGIIAEIDLHQARIQREIAASAIPVFRRAVAHTEHALSILLGRLPQGFDVDEGPDLFASPPYIPAGLPSQLLERRPDVAQAEALLHAQTARIGVAQAMRFPSISLTGLFGGASNELSTLLSDGLGWSAGGGLLAPIFNFNKNVRRVDIEKARAQQALLQYENAVLQAFREVEDALVDVQTYRTQVEAKKREYESASQAAELARSRYDKGVTSYLEVLEAERSLFNVELQYSEVQQLYNNAYVRLYKALGGGWKLEETD